MRVVIIGQKWLAAELLHQCHRQGYQVIAVSAPGGDRLATEAEAYATSNYITCPNAISSCAPTHTFLLAPPFVPKLYMAHTATILRYCRATVDVTRYVGRCICGRP